MKNTLKCALILVVLLAALVPSLALAMEYVPGEAIVVLKGGAGRSAGDVARAAAESAAARSVKTYDALSERSGNVFALFKSDTKSTEELIADLEAIEDIVAVSPNHIKRAFATPNDARYGELWGMKKIGAEAAWDITSGDSEIYVAVIDTGVDKDHPDLAANIAADLGRNFLEGKDVSDFSDGDGHGTHVSGTIGAVGDNGIGVAGVNWRVKIIPIRILGDDGTGPESGEIEALNYLVELLTKSPDLKLAAVNLSLGGYGSRSPQDKQARRDPDWLAYKALDSLNKTVIVVAAGNEGVEVGAPVPFDIRNTSTGEVDAPKGGYCYPASYTGIDNLIVVGALAEGDNKAAYFSNWSQRTVDIAAPGLPILSTYPVSKGSYVSKGGTSMAAPHVAGAVALLASVSPDLKADALKKRILGTADYSENPHVLADASPASDPMVIPDPQLVPDRKVSAYGLLRIDRALSSNVATSTQRVTGLQVRLSYDKTLSDKIYVNEDVIAVAVVTPSNAMNRKVTWSSSDSAIADVDYDTGKVKARKKGSARIIATASDGSGITGYADITVHSIIDDILDGGGGGCSASAYGIALLVCATIITRTRRNKDAGI